MNDRSPINSLGKKQPGWFSRRHRTNEARLDAQRAWRLRQATKLARARAQNEETAEREDRAAARATRVADLYGRSVR